jgi:hypothetical protein
MKKKVTVLVENSDGKAKTFDTEYNFFRQKKSPELKLDKYSFSALYSQETHATHVLSWLTFKGILYT